jgi:hypothetical protein
MPKQNKPTPKVGSFRRDRGAKSNTTGKSQSGSIIGKITAALWGKKGGWDGRR